MFSLCKFLFNASKTWNYFWAALNEKTVSTGVRKRYEMYTLATKKAE